MTLRWSRRAAQDLDGISVYLRENAPAFEERIVLEIWDRTQALQDMPMVGKMTGRAGVRQVVIPFSEYIIYYKLVNDAVHLLRIRHGARKPLKF